MDAHDGGTGAVTGSDLLQRQGIGDGTGFRPAIVLRDQHAEETEPAHFFQLVFREPAFPVARASTGGEPLAGEIAGHVPDLLLGFVQDHRRLPSV
ncbi:hypothetical protein D3C86_1185180 [compost metagenome]